MRSSHRLLFFILDMDQIIELPIDIQSWDLHRSSFTDDILDQSADGGIRWTNENDSPVKASSDAREDPMCDDS